MERFHGGPARLEAGAVWRALAARQARLWYEGEEGDQLQPRSRQGHIPIRVSRPPLTDGGNHAAARGRASGWLRAPSQDRAALQRMGRWALKCIPTCVEMVVLIAGLDCCLSDTYLRSCVLGDRAVESRSLNTETNQHRARVSS